MRRLPISPRLQFTALGLALGIGVGVGAATLWPASAEGAPVAELASTAATSPASASPTAPAAKQIPTDPSRAPKREWSPTPPAAADPARLTLDEVKAIAVKVAPGRVVEIDEDDELTGLRYDVTIRHSNHTSTDLEIDAATGKVLSIDHDDDWD